MCQAKLDRRLKMNVSQANSSTGCCCGPTTIVVYGSVAGVVFHSLRNVKDESVNAD